MASATSSSSVGTTWQVDRHVDAVVPAGGGNIVVSTSSLTGSVWDGRVYGLMSSGKIEAELEVDVTIADLAIFDEGQFVAACDDGTARIVHGEGVMVLVGGHNGAATGASVWDRQIATGGSDRFVYIWNMRPGAEQKEPDHFEAHADCINSIQWGPNSLLTSSSDGTAATWDVRQRPWHSTVNMRVGSPACTAAYAKGTDKVLVSNENNEIHCYEMRNPAKPLWIEKSFQAQCRRIATAPLNPKIVAIASDSPSVGIMNVDTGKVLSRFFNHNDFVRGLAWDPENPKKLYSGSWDKTVMQVLVKTI